MERRHYSGTAAPTTLSAGIDSSTLTIPVTSGTGYPSGTIGPFFIVIDRGLATEEKIKCVTTVSNTITGAPGGRGADGTTASSHSLGAVVEHVLTADDIDSLNAHAADVADDHEQYAMADGTRFPTTAHDLTGRHAFGGALGNPGTPTSVADTADAGSGTTPARWDHVHDFGDNWVNFDTVLRQSVIVAHTEEHARYMLIGNFIIVEINVIVNAATGTSGQAIDLQMPAAPISNGLTLIGQGLVYDSSASTFYPGFAIPVAGDPSRVRLMNSSGAYIGVGGPQLANSDMINVNVAFKYA